MFCTSCGTKLADGSKFCTSCGAKVSSPIVTPAAEPVVEPTVEETAPVVEEVVETAAETVEEATPVVEAVEEVAETVAETAVEEAVEPVAETVEEATPDVEATTEEVVEPVAETVEETAPVVEAAVEATEPAAETVEETAPAVEEIKEKVASATDQTISYEQELAASRAQNAYNPIPEEPKKGKAGLVVGIFLIFILIAAAGACAWYFLLREKPMDKFEAALEKNEYKEARDIYEELDKKEYGEAATLVAKEIEEAFASYKDGKIASCADLKETIEDIEKIDCDEDVVIDALKDAYKKITKLEESEQAYVTGCARFDEKKYVKSIKKLASVIDGDPNYKNAQKKIEEAVDEIIKEAESSVNNNDFSNATYVLEDGIETLKSSKLDSLADKVQKKLDEINAAKLDQEKKENLANIEQYITNEEYSNAYNYALRLFEANPNDNDYADALDNAMVKYGDSMVVENLDIYKDSKCYNIVLSRIAVGNMEDDIYAKAAERFVTNNQSEIENYINTAIQNNDFIRVVDTVGALSVILKDNTAVSEAYNAYGQLNKGFSFSQLNPAFFGNKMGATSFDAYGINADFFAYSFDISGDAEVMHSAVASNTNGVLKYVKADILGTEFNSGKFVAEIVCDGTVIATSEEVEGQKFVQMFAAIPETATNVAIKIRKIDNDASTEARGYIIDPTVVLLDFADVQKNEFKLGLSGATESTTDSPVETIPDGTDTDVQPSEEPTETPDTSVDNAEDIPHEVGEDIVSPSGNVDAPDETGTEDEKQTSEDTSDNDGNGSIFSFFGR